MAYLIVPGVFGLGAARSEAMPLLLRFYEAKGWRYVDFREIIRFYREKLLLVF
jgi:hypothetical protein